MWMGSKPPLGYNIEDRRLVVKADDTPKVNLIYEQYLKAWLR
ncbi:MAG: hypothetical protein OSB62_08470 [Alphaproteobacteria bacterium]|nr:hypothetical protein [Alphaproteobacteria bacterium]